MKWKTVSACLFMCVIMTCCLTACKGAEEQPNDGQEVLEKTEKNGEDYELKELLRSNKSLVATTEIIGHVPFPKVGKVCQGGYTDGKYFYQAFIIAKTDSGEVDNDVTVVKYDIENESVVKESAVLKLNHCNDFTYNPKLGKLLVCNATGRKNIVSIMDPDTLEIEGEVDLGFEIFSINYNESRNQYVVGIAGGQTFRILDAEFQIASDIYDPTTRAIGYITQGNACDDNFIYFVLYQENVITVYDWDGNFVSWINLDIPNAVEPENISVIGNDIYIGGSGNGHEIYKIKTLRPEE